MKPLARQILTFLCLAFLFSLVPYGLMIRSHHIGVGNGVVVRMIMWCPAAAAFATCAIFRNHTRSLGWGWHPIRFEAPGYLLPLAYAIPVYAVMWIAVPGSFAGRAFEEKAAASLSMSSSPHFATFGLMIPMLATLGVIGSLANALVRLQRWHHSGLFARLLYADGNCGRLHPGMAASQIRQPMAMRASPRQSQSFHPGNLG